MRSAVEDRDRLAGHDKGVPRRGGDVLATPLTGAAIAVPTWASPRMSPTSPAGAHQVSDGPLQVLAPPGHLLRGGAQPRAQPAGPTRGSPMCFTMLRRRTASA